MSRKTELKKEIDDKEREIEALEKKRARSQSALMTAMLTNTKPKKEDVDYFTTFSALIDKEREELRKLYKELAELANKK